MTKVMQYNVELLIDIATWLKANKHVQVLAGVSASKSPIPLVRGPSDAVHLNLLNSLLNC